MNQVLDERYLESITRLAVGIEPTDAVRAAPIGFGVTVAVDGVPLRPAFSALDPNIPWWEPQDVLPRIRRNDACRHLFVFRVDPAHPAVVRVRDPAGRGPALSIEDPLDVRIWDPTRRFVARRLRMGLPALPQKGRVVRPALFPGAAYDLPAGAVACRGLVVRDGEPMPWARVEARRGAGVVGHAHGDDRGEFLLLLGGAAVSAAALQFPIRLDVVVFGPKVKPAPATTPAAKADPLGDLPLEEVPAGSAGDAVLAGTTGLPGYRASAGGAVQVEFGPDGPVSGEFAFT